jgi:hypothetical protein
MSSCRPTSNSLTADALEAGVSETVLLQIQNAERGDRRTVYGCR